MKIKHKIPGTYQSGRFLDERGKIVYGGELKVINPAE